MHIRFGAFGCRTRSFYIPIRRSGYMTIIFTYEKYIWVLRAYSLCSNWRVHLASTIYNLRAPLAFIEKTLLLRSFIHLYKRGVHLILYLDPKPDPFFNLILDPDTTQISYWIRIQIQILIQMDQIYKDRFGFRTSMALPWIGPVCIPSFSDNIFFKI